MYGSPPPPVPSTAAPTARSSRSFSETSRNGRLLEPEVTDCLHPDSYGIAGEVANRDVVNIDYLDRAGKCAGCNGLVDSLLLRLAQRMIARPALQGVDAINLATDL